MYTVKSGDSLWKIARQQNVSVAAIKQANNLSSDSLKIGQKLHIPAPAMASASASTTPGATPSGISAGIATTANSEWREPGTYTENGQTMHVVDVGESPSVIARKYGVKVDELMKANSISDAKRIWVGEKLVIPTAQSQESTPPPAAAPTATTTPASAPTAPPVTAAPIVSAKPPTTGN